MTKEDIIKTLRSEGLNIDDHDHVLMLKAENQGQIETFERRITELNFRNSYGWFGPKDGTYIPEETESESINKPEDNLESDES